MIIFQTKTHGNLSKPSKASIIICCVATSLWWRLFSLTPVLRPAMDFFHDCMLMCVSGVVQTRLYLFLQAVNNNGVRMYTGIHGIMNFPSSRSLNVHNLFLPKREKSHKEAQTFNQLCFISTKSPSGELESALKSAKLCWQCENTKVIAALEFMAGVPAILLCGDDLNEIRTFFLFLGKEAAQANLLSMNSAVLVQAELLALSREIASKSMCASGFYG